MKSRIIIFGVILLLGSAGLGWSADLFFWESKKGVNVTDDPSKLPPKFKEKYEQFKIQQPKDVVKQVKATPESAKNAIRALKKLEARCQSGISYRDFSPALGEAKFEANMFLESKAANDFKNIKLAIEDTLFHYDSANMMWRHAFNSGHKLHTTYGLNDQFVINFLKLYPLANKPESDGGILYMDEYVKKDVAVLQYMIRYIFSQASLELKKGFDLVNQ